MRGAIWLVAAFLATGGTALVAESSAKASRLTVTVLTFEDQTADPDAAHWRYTIERLLGEQLHEAKALRRVPAAFGYRQLKVKRGGPISVEQARKIGELIEARRVVWGSYRREGQQWLVTARMLNVASGKAGRELKAVSADWYEMRDQLADQVLKELGVKPGDAERRKMLQRGTSVPGALESYSKAWAGREEREPRAELEISMRKAVRADPQYAEAHTALAAVLGSQGKLEAAERAARQGVKLSPESAHAHDVLGFVLMFQGNLAEAEKELRAALRLDAEDVDTLLRLGECAHQQGKLDKAIAFWNEARRLDPTDAAVCAHLGDAYAKKRERDKAMQALQEAERLDPDAVNAQQILWQGYETLHETPLALEHLERFLTLARKEGLAPKVLEHAKQSERELRARLTPHEITAAPPKTYTAQTLDAALRARLTRAEYKQVINPLASTPAMDHWAQELVRGATNDLDQARKIFEALARHLDKDETGTRTAREVFALWNDPARSFCCQEYAKLYVALARVVGVNAFYVHLEKDYSGEVVYHDCAAVFAGGKAFLADPAYRWFGPPHQDYLLLDDLQAIAHHFFQYSGKGNQVARCRLAEKLHPDMAWGKLALASALINANKLGQAVQTLKVAQQLQPGRWDAYILEGMIAARTHDLDLALDSLRKGIELNPKYGPSHAALGWVLAAQGRLTAARDEYRLALSNSSMLSADNKALVLRAIANLNEKLPAK